MASMTLYRDESIFKFEQIPQIPAEANNYIQMEISFEMNLDVLTIQRTYYSLLDVLADIGGLMSITLEIFAICLVIINYQHLENYMAVNLFKIDTGERTDERLKLPKFSNFKDFFCDRMPSCLKSSCCNKKNRNARALEKARD